MTVIAKTVELKSVVIDCIRYNYFYKREKNDINGNPRYRVYLIDPENNATYESVFKCYEAYIESHVEIMIQRMLEG